MTENKRSRIQIVLLIVFGALIYLNSLQGVFVMDDLKEVVYNDKLHSWSWSFLSNVRRPLLYLTFALNFFLGGTNPFGYHLINIALHVSAAIFLFKIISLGLRRADQTPHWTFSPTVLAFAVALLWLVHPIQTESVTYIVQRAESLSGMLYLAAFYYALQFFFRENWRTLIFSFTAFLLSGLTKETAVTLPVLVLLYDRSFVSSSTREALKRHKKLYLSFGLIWLVMGWLLISTHPEEIPTAGFGFKGISALQYAANQPAVILHYLKLLAWPLNLVFDYDWPVKSFIANFLPILFLGMLIASTAYFYRRYKVFGFAALSFFVLLLPSSSVIPLRDLAFEHRLYLPSACFVFLLVMGFAQLIEFLIKNPQLKIKAGVAGLCVVVLFYSALTIRRHQDYHSALALWQDTVQKRPLNARAFNNLGTELVEVGKNALAVTYFRQAISLKNDYVSAYLNLGTALENLGWLAKAETQFRHSLALDPKHSSAHSKLGMVLVRQGRLHEALVEFQLAAELGPKSAVDYYNWGAALLQLGRVKEALPIMEQSVELGFNKPKIFAALAVCYDKTGQKEKAQAMMARAQAQGRK